MSNEPGGPAPLPEPYAAPGGREPDRGPVQPPPAPYAPSAPAQPDLGPAPAGGTSANPFAPQQPGAAPPYGTPPPASYGPPATGSPYGQPPTNGAPGYGQAPPPPYGTPYGPYAATPYGPSPYGPYGADPSQETESLATAAMVTSLVGLVFGLAMPVGFVLGIVALRRIRRNGKRGRGMAIAGVVVGGLGIVYFVGIVLLVIGLIAGTWGSWDGSGTFDSGTSGSGTDQQADDTIPDYTLRADLLVGDCLDTYAYEWDMSDSTVVSCEVPHEGEVVATITMSGPGSTSLSDDDPVWDAASAACDQQAAELLHDDAGLGDIVLYAPHPADFANGGTTAYCTFFTDGDLFTGSAVQHTLTSSAPAGSET